MREQRKKNKQIIFRVTEEDHKKIKSKVEKSKLLQNEYLTRAAINKEIIIIDDLRDYSEQIRRIGINVNQLAKKANHGQLVDKDEISQVKEELKKIWQLLRSLAQKAH